MSWTKPHTRAHEARILWAGFNNLCCLKYFVQIQFLLKDFVKYRDLYAINDRNQRNILQGS